MRKSVDNENARDASVTSLKKKLVFDEGNIDATFHPLHKDYGLMKVTEANTPYPRYEDPVDASILRKRLAEKLMLPDNMMMDPSSSSTSSDKLNEFSVYEKSPPENVIEDVMPIYDETASSASLSLFELQRKAFDRREYCVSQQRRQSAMLHKPMQLNAAFERLSEFSQHVLPSNTPSMTFNSSYITHEFRDYRDSD